jgi:hypothetical protein
MRSPMARASWAFLVDSVPFTKAVRDGETSLGGSESACLGLARALVPAWSRGARLRDASRRRRLRPGRMGRGVAPARGIHHRQQLHRIRRGRRPASAQLLPVAHPGAPARAVESGSPDTGAGQGVMAIGWALDKIVYVSEYHRKQWEAIQSEIAPLGAVTKNGYDPAHVPTSAVKDPNRIIHISRPERGLGPLLQMWPAFKARNPQATLQICRYQSMYDGEGHERPRHLPVVRRTGQGRERAGRRDRVSRLAEQGATLPGDRGSRGHVVSRRRELRGDVVHRGDRSAGLRHAVRRLAAGRAARDGLSVLRSGAAAHRRRLRGRVSERRDRAGRAPARRLRAADVRIPQAAAGRAEVRRDLHLRRAGRGVGSDGRRLVRRTLRGEQGPRHAATAARGRSHDRDGRRARDHSRREVH